MHNNIGSLLAVLTAFLSLLMRWRWEYVWSLIRSPKVTFKYVLIWLGILLILCRIFWQIKPEYFN